MRRAKIGETSTLYFPPNLFTPELTEAEVGSTWLYRLDQFAVGEDVTAVYTLDGSYVGITMEIPETMRPGTYYVRFSEPESDQTIFVENVELHS